MRKLILVKHSLPQLVPDLAANLWRLGQEGQDNSTRLAALLAGYRPETIISSQEPKAVETGEIVAAELGIRCQSKEGLREHDRSNVEFFHDQDRWHGAVARFFDEPDQLVLGRETAAQALNRFSLAVDDVLSERESGNVVIVAHGTVISLYVASHTDSDPFELWQRLGLPSFVVLSIPEIDLLEIVDGV